MKRLAVIVAVIALIFIGRDIYCWRFTLQRMDRISQLQGKTIQEARDYLNTNRNILAIADVREYNTDNNRWLTVSLDKVSYMGILVFWLSGPNSWFSMFKISGLLVLPIENERIVGCRPVL